MLRAVVLLAAASRVVCRTNLSTASVRPESLELLNAIKQDLRRDNDDYVEQTPRPGQPRGSLLNVTSRSSNNTTPEHNQLHKKRLKDTRRNALPALNLRNFQSPAINPISTGGQQLRTDPHTKLPPAVARSLAGMLKAQGYTHQYPKKYSGAADRLRFFIEKNKDKVQEYVDNKKQQVRDGVKMKAHTTSEETDTEEARHRLPSVDQLDLAPAIGGRVHSMRLKGRLCQRSVLMPEGPKYDSKGQVYLREHSAAAAGGRGYDGTAPPPLLLPRCCNCCKKSVLGCE